MTLASASSTASIILKVTALSTPSSPQHRSTHSISGGIADRSGATAVSCEAIGPHTVPTGPKPSAISADSAAYRAEATVTSFYCFANCWHANQVAVEQARGGRYGIYPGAGGRCRDRQAAGSARQRRRALGG